MKARACIATPQRVYVSPHTLTPDRQSPEPVMVFADLVIPRRPPTPNDWTKKHWRTYHKIKTLWGQELRHELGKARKVATGRRIIEAQRERGPRERAFDWDNAVGGLKPVIDQLVSLGWLPGDANGELRLVLAPDRRTPKPGLRLLIREPLTAEWDPPTPARVLFLMNDPAG